MNRLVTTSQMREIDRKTIEEVGIPGLLLMENAGLGVVRIVEALLSTGGGKRIHIFCGTGNNGGDGFVVARHLFNHGFDVSLFLVGDKNRVRGDAQVNIWLRLEPCHLARQLLRVPKVVRGEKGREPTLRAAQSQVARRCRARIGLIQVAN